MRGGGEKGGRGVEGRIRPIHFEASFEARSRDGAEATGGRAGSEVMMRIT